MEENHSEIVNPANEVVKWLEASNMHVDKDAFKIWADICDLHGLTFKTGLIYAHEPAHNVIVRIADAGRGIIMLTAGKPAKIFVDLELLKG